MPNTPENEPKKIERRDFLKKTGTAAGVIATGFPGIISGKTVTNALKIGVIGCGGRGTGAAAQALRADPNNELTAVSDIDQAIIDRAKSRLLRSEDFGDRVKLDHVSAIAVGTGPGMFTGLRVGVTTGKVLAQALRVPMIPP